MIDWTEATAVGTLALAAATFLLALKTKALADTATKELTLVEKQIAETQRQSVTAEAALTASIRPVLVDVPRPTFRRGPKTTTLNPAGFGTKSTADIDVSQIRSESADERLYLIVPVRNVGPGPARVTAVTVTAAGEGQTGAPVAVGRGPSVIAAGEVAEVRFTAETGSGPAKLIQLLRTDDDLVVEASYTDVAGRQGAASQLLLQKRGPDQYSATGVRLLDEPQFTAP